VASEALITELERAPAYPRLRARISPDEAATFVAVLRGGAILAADPAEPERRSADASDDYLIALAEQEQAVLVSGDKDLLALGEELPI
jgi:predicted nucleic acid-binding protein